MSRSMLVLVIGVAVTATLLPAAPASATYSGQNGLVAFKRGSDIYTVTATGGNLRRLTYQGGARPRWRTDGQRIVFERNGGVWSMRADGGDKRRVVTSGKHPTWSPTGRIVYVGTGVEAATNCTFSQIFSVSESGTDRRALTPAPQYCDTPNPHPEYSHPGFGPTGDLLYHVDIDSRYDGFGSSIRSTSYGVRWNVWCAYGAPGEIVECNASFKGRWFQPNYLPTGRNYLMVTDANFTGETDGRRRLWLQDAQSDWRRRVGTDLDVADPASSPDGKHALYARLTPNTTPVIRQHTYATNTVKTLVTNGTQPDWQPLP